MSAIQAAPLFQALAALNAVAEEGYSRIPPGVWQQCVHARVALKEQLERAGLTVEVQQEPA